MPQLMPLMWVTSIFMWMLMLMILIDLYYYMMSYELIFMEGMIKSNLKYLW